jgi:histidinol-phosphate/aromatic aminotransferase/cobyric acid decarboxylase-like protein
LIVLKSISKSFGVPGIRLGLMCSSDEKIIKDVRSALPVWNINSFAEFFLQKLSNNMKEFWESCSKVIESREDLHNNLENIGLEVFPSHANFLLVKLPEQYNIKHFLTFMIKSNILIKSLDKKTGMPNGNYIRLSVRTKEENAELIKAIKTYMVLYNNDQYL